MKVCAVFLICLHATTRVVGYKFFQDRIPYGSRVPHPCFPNHLWRGVGHTNPLGGGTRNPFGLDFEANGKVWDKKLCMMDSDGDGMSNGEELNDPDCTWQPGDAQQNKPAKSHPGICQPLDHPKCKGKNDWNICEKKEFTCEGTKEEGVSKMTIRLSKTQVPDKVTNYYCQLLDLPFDREYDIIADKPSLDNENVIHHMLLYGCREDVGYLEKFTTPQPCGMVVQGACGHVLAGWTVGGVGDCFDGIPAGTRIGRGHFTRAMLEVHWNNPEKRSDYQDESGMILYYTTQLRQYPMGVLTVGQMGLKIPPKQSKYITKSDCMPSCTKSQLPYNINIVSAGLHMHYTGTGGTLDLYRDGRKETVIINEENFSYDNPEDYNHDPAVVMKPGDELRMSCTFNTKTNGGFIYYGDATSDEMCYSFITYYPKTDFTECVQFGDHDFCAEDKEAAGFISGCNTEDETELDVVVNEVYDNCVEFQCSEECMNLMTVDPHPCMVGDAKLYLEWLLPYLNESLASYPVLSRSCDLKLYTKNQNRAPQPPGNGVNGVRGQGLSLMATLIILLYAPFRNIPQTYYS